VLLNKLESGFLLLQTERGLVAVEPSFWQRVYLLWTFRNFRQLSLPLLNPRQIALINNLFRQHAKAASQEFEPWLEIGLVENFVPAAIEIAATLAAKTNASPVVATELAEQTSPQNVAPPGLPIAATPATEADVPPAVKMENAEEEETAIDRAEFAPGKALDRSFAPRFPWFRRAWSNLAAFKPAMSRPQVSRNVILGFAAAIVALALSVSFFVAFHRIGAAPGSQAHSSLPQLNVPDSPSAPESTSVPEDPASVPEGPPHASDAPDAAVKPSPSKVAPPITTTHRMTTPERASRGATARVVSRSRAGSRAAAFSRAPASTSTRRMTLAPGPLGTVARSAQSYFDLANRQMHMGNYAAAAANYKRAWRIEEASAAAKGRLARARRTMLAEKESIANR